MKETFHWLGILGKPSYSSLQDKFTFFSMQSLSTELRLFFFSKNSSQRNAFPECYNGHFWPTGIPQCITQQPNAYIMYIVFFRLKMPC